MLQKNEFPLILAKGEPVLKRRVIKRFFLDLSLNSRCKIRAGKFGNHQKQRYGNTLYLGLYAIDDDATMVHYPDGNSVVVDLPLESAIHLKSDLKYTSNVKGKENIVVVVEFQNYASNTKMWMECENYDDTPLIMAELNVAEPLTAAYI